MNTASRVGHSLAAYGKAVVQNAAITIFLFILGFAVAEVPWWFLTGLVCGVLNLVPNLGPVLSLALGAFIQYMAKDDWTSVLWVGSAWLLIQIIDGFVLSPRAAARAGVNPFLSIVLVLVAGLMFGPVGMLLAVPVAAIVLIVYKAVRAS